MRNARAAGVTNFGADVALAFAGTFGGYTAGTDEEEALNADRPQARA